MYTAEHVIACDVPTDILIVEMCMLYRHTRFNSESHDLLIRYLSFILELEELVCQFDYHVILGCDGFLEELNLHARLLQCILLAPVRKSIAYSYHTEGNLRGIGFEGLNTP